MIKAIIFDYFGVICSDEYWNFVKADKNVESDFKQLSNAVNLGKLRWQEFIATIANKTNQSPETVEKLYETGRINPDFISYIIELKKTYKTALLTNASYEFLEPTIEKTHLNDVFDAIVISSRVGFIKPRPEIFGYMLDKLGVEPEEAVFIDDIIPNVEASKALGIQSILYKDFERFKRDLQAVLNAG